MASHACARRCFMGRTLFTPTLEIFFIIGFIALLNDNYIRDQNVISFGHLSCLQGKSNGYNTQLGPRVYGNMSIIVIIIAFNGDII